ncbi:Ppx/GppA family phosphatase [Nocardioides iriomotensis]|uniref:Ppx/GppA family phosphatase n=1 Tax=Nocardioides iriomotensis TaxID=715784 RepID=A0A4Q5IXB6_9ACTN|nr:Ppx/GppA family phosphatase [Nocardioides iriomotensis]RYU09838.1 Ppx/GppA family phosphatase [Nocardioides iriomotensis]
MTEIVPRWEWRSFGDLDWAFAGLTPHDVLESTEVYLVSAAGADVVKVRYELMDVKHLLQTDDNGLEQWTPVVKAPFPLGEADARAVAGAVGVAAETLTGAPYPQDDLLAQLAVPGSGVVAVEVAKRRQRYDVDGCAAELTEVRTPYGSTGTVAIEDEDADLVMRTVRGLGLGGRPNVNFLRGLRALLGLPADRVAVIDVGTNSVKFHVGERTDDGWRAVVDRAEITRLGEGLQEGGGLQPEPMARTVEAISDMADEACRQRVAAIAAVGTAGLRMASNGADFVAGVRKRCGVDIDVISGEDEARLAYRAATEGLGASGARVVFDTGGGSSQFTFGNGDEVVERFSVPVGAVRFTERYGLDATVSEAVLAEALDAIAGDLSRLDGRPTPELVVGLGGAVTNLAAVMHGLTRYDPDVIQGTVLERDEIDRQIELYRTRDAEQRRSIDGLQPQRAEVILAGACVVRTILAKLAVDSFRVSDRGLRHGVLAERFG